MALAPPAPAAADANYDRLKEVKEFDESKTGVKGLSDAGVTSIPRIFIHPPDTLSSLRSSISSSSTLTIPVIDLSDLNSPDRRITIVDQIKEAASTWGFFQVINHGLPASLMDGIVGAIKAFHEQPQQAKQEHYKRDERDGFMYASNNDLYRGKAASWHDYIQAWMSPNPPDLATIPEICRREVVEWDAHVRKVGEDLLELLCEGLGVERGRFKDMTRVDGRVLVGICYPYCPQPDLTVGLTSHTDPGMVTVLLQNHVPGLQVKHGDDWFDIKPVPGGLIINVGDFLQILSNDEYKSVQHRVRANTSMEPRISVVMFFNVGKWEETDKFGPLPELVSPEKPANYRNFTMHEFGETFFGKGLDSKTVIQNFKI